MLKGFKEFALKGNVIDLAVGVIIGTAFAKIVDSLVKDIIMPVVSLIIPSRAGYVGWKITLNAKEIPFGRFIGEVVNFIIIAFILYIVMVKIISWLTKARKEEKAAAPAAPSREVQLLTEIRDTLVAQKS